MKNRYLGIVAFPVVAVSLATLLVNGIGVLISGGAEREPTTTNRMISLLIGISIMTMLYSIPAFKRWIPNRKNLGKHTVLALLGAFVAVICTGVAGYAVYTNVVNEAFHWTTSPEWLDGKQVARGMCFMVLVAWWVFKKS